MPLRPASLFLSTLLAIATCAQAEIYKHVDKDGRVTFTNMPMKGAKRVDVMSNLPSSVAAPSKARSGEGKASSNPSPADFPKVDNATQKNRDVLRKQIWAEELANEEKQLAESRKLLSAASADKQARVRDDITLHEKNIEAIKKEIARAN